MRALAPGVRLLFRKALFRSLSSRPVDGKDCLVILRTRSLTELVQGCKQSGNRIRLHHVRLNPPKPKLDAVHALGFADAIAQQNDAIADG
jgi:hypothetical protein